MNTTLQNLSKQFGKFAAVGLASTAINYAVFFIGFQLFHVFYAWAHVAGYITGVVAGYFFNRSWTFSSVIEKKHKEFILYFLVYITSLVLSVAVLQILVERLGINPLLANLLSIGLSIATNFLGCKFLVFNPKRIAQLGKISKLFFPAFYGILAIKIIASFCFGSHYLVKGFLPFTAYFSSTLQNPYQHFFNLGELVFPYPGGMLAILSAPYAVLSRVLPHSFFENLNFQLFVIRLPILAFDILLYVILCLLLPTKEKKVLWLYFASPVLFYINYFHGQLDIIPTGLLFLSIFLLFRGRNTSAFLALGLGIAAKTHLLAALPFYWLYLYRNNFKLNKIAWLTLSAFAAFLIFNPFILSSGFVQTVFNNPEQQRLFSLSLSFGLNNLTFFVAPAAILLILYKFSGYKKLNLDSLLLSLGLTYIVLIALVPPMQGWFYWSLPFLVFFFVKFSEFPSPVLWVLNCVYLLYFIVNKNSDIFESLGPIASKLSLYPNPYNYIASSGKDAAIVQNIIFTALEAMLLASAAWAYGAGNSAIKLFQKKKQRFILGIAGDSGVGKSTLVKLLENVTGRHNSVILNGDDVHKWERGDPRWQEVTHLNPKGNKVHTDLEHALSLLRGETVQRLAYDHASGTFIGPMEIRPNKFIIFQGLMPFMLGHMRDLHDLKIYVEADETLREKWKAGRDREERGKSNEDIKTQIESRKPDAEKFIHPQKGFADWTIRYGNKEDGSFFAEHIFKNSIFLENLLEELSKFPGLKTEHSYSDLSFQRLFVSGTVSAGEIKELAYKVFPNMLDLVENQPIFEEGQNGIHQLLFINYLDQFNKKHEKLS